MFAVLTASPSVARERTGTVVLWITVVEDGTISRIEVESEKPSGYGLAKIAKENVAGWKFTTAKPGRYKVTVKVGYERPIS